MPQTNTYPIRRPLEPIFNDPKLLGAQASTGSGGGPPAPTNPTVTINQGASQADPSPGPNFTFDIVFSQAVVGFTSADITLSGTAGATTVSVSPGYGTTYTATVSGMTAAGTVTATISAGVCVGLLTGLPNLASTSTDNTITFGPNTAMQTAIAALTPVGYWILDESSGTTAFDSSGNGRHGTYAGSGYALQGIVGAGAVPYSKFGVGGVTGRVVVPDNAAFSNATLGLGMTFFGIVKPNSVTSTTTVDPLFDKGLTASTQREYNQSLNGSGADGRLNGGKSALNGSTIQVANAAGIITTAWQAVAIVMPNSSGLRNLLYRNDNTDRSTSYSGSATGSWADGSADLYIGQYQYDATQFMKGGMAHMAIFAATLNATQIQTLMTAAQASGWF